MSFLRTVEVVCPFCWEPVLLAVDTSGGEQSYIEDCAVCCRPINISVQIWPDGEVSVRAEV